MFTASISRRKLQDHLERTELACEEQTRELERFKEQKMGETINYNVALSDRQQTYSRLAAKTLERNTFLQNIQEKITEKRFSYHSHSINITGAVYVDC